MTMGTVEMRACVTENHPDTIYVIKGIGVIA